MKKIIAMLCVSIMLLSGALYPDGSSTVYAESSTDTTSEPQFVSDQTVVVSAIREAMVKRENALTIYYLEDQQGDVQAGFPTKWMELALAETDNPNEGDYLREHLVDWSARGTVRRYDDGREEITYKFTFTYYTTAEQERALEEAVDLTLDEIGVSESLSDYDNVKKIYDYICENVMYDNNNLKDDSYTLKYTAYAALVNKTAVCQGYATLFYYMVKEAGVDARIISGMGKGVTHAWNIVMLDEEYYYLDATWDAGKTDYDYFLKGAYAFKDHTCRNEYKTSGFFSQHPLSESDYGSDYVPPAVEIVASGICGDSATWELDTDGRLTISGTGKVSATSGWPWENFKLNIKKVIVGEGITCIGGYAFEDCVYLKSVEMFPSVTEIGTGTFKGCTSLSHIVLPEGVSFIGAYAFYECISLKELEIPENVSFIDYHTFYGCSSLQNIVLSEKTHLIRESAFEGCSSLKQITIPEKVTEIKSSTFSKCSSLESVEIPESVTEIGDYAFWQCSSLESIKIPESVTKVGVGAFWNCDSLRSVELPEKMTTISEGMFAHCKKLENVEMSQNIVSIGKSAFYDCSSLVNIVIPENVINIGEYAFELCKNLTTIVIPKNVTMIGTRAFELCSPELVIYLKSAYVKEYAEANGISYAIIPDSIEIKEMPYKTEYCLNETFDGKGLIITAKCDDGLSFDVDSELVFSGFDSTKAGNNTVNVTYGGQEVSFDVMVYDAHAMGEWTDVTLPTYTVKGVKERTCSRCGHVEQAEVEKHVATDIALSHTELELFKGNSVVLTVNCEPFAPAEGDVIWLSSNEHVIRIEQNGKITAISNGKATITVTVGELSAFCQVEVVNGKWITDSTGTYYQYANGTIPSNCWQQIDGAWYYFNAKSVLETNKWIKDSVGWCYVGADGRCVTNCWKKDSIGWCYLDSNGRMATNCWIMDSVGWCYVGADGYCVTNCWKQDSIGWCYLDANGRMATNCWIMDSVGWCYVGADGYCVTNRWMRDSIGWCYLGADGRMVTNQWVRDSQGWCYIGANGYMI